VVQRIPGITVQRDQGEGRYVQLRGTAPEFTNFNINGEQISSPESGARYVGLDAIAADQIEMIEVTKSSDT
jgi:outer membrane receptor for ferrienterochelin and colicin